MLNNVDSKHDDGYSYYNNYNEYYGARRETPKIDSARPATRPPAARLRAKNIDPVPCVASFVFSSSSSLLPAHRLCAQAVATLRTGDVFEMRLSGMPQEYAAEFSLQFTVGQDGTVNVPLIGEVKAAGLTSTQLERTIQNTVGGRENFHAADGDHQYCLGGAFCFGEWRGACPATPAMVAGPDPFLGDRKLPGNQRFR